MASNHSSLSDDVTALIAGYLDFLDILRLRKVNRFFERVTRMQMVLAEVYQSSTLALPPLERATSARELERRLVFAAHLDKRLSVPHPAPRSVWTIENLPEHDSPMSQKILENGTHLLAFYTEPAFICADLETRESWILPLPHPHSKAGLFDAVKIRLDGRDGILIVYAEYNRCGATVYFHPFDTQAAPESSRLILHRQFETPTGVYNVTIVESKLFIRANKILVFDMEDGGYRDYPHFGPVLALIDDYLTVARAHSQRRHRTKILLTLRSLSDINAPTITTTVIIPQVHAQPSFSRHRLPNPQNPSVVSLFATSDDTIYRVDIRHLLPDANNNDVVPQPINYKVQSSNITQYLFPPDLPSNHPLKHLTPSGISCRYTCFGSTRAVTVMEGGSCRRDGWQLVLSTFEDQQIHHRSLHIHDAQVTYDLEVGMVEWDEVSGRLCLFGYYDQSLLPAPIIILEF